MVEDDFKELAAAGVKLTERYSYDSLWNGVSVAVAPSQVSTLESIPGVKAVYPVHTVSLPDWKSESGGSAIDLKNAVGMTGADQAQNELGLDGSGVTIAIAPDCQPGHCRMWIGPAGGGVWRTNNALADEPVASLDPATSHSVMKYLEEINKKDGITVICSLHFLSLARRYGTRVIALKGGKVAFDGKPEDIDERRFKEIYGEDAVEVEIGPERSIPQPLSATEAGLKALADDTDTHI